MAQYTSSHWGIQEVDLSDPASPHLKPLSSDPHPSPIGYDPLGEDLRRLRVQRPAVRRSWLSQGPGAMPELRGHEPFIEVEWDRALDLVAQEVNRIRQQHGNAAIFGGSYGWSSAGRFHHAQSQVHRFLNSVGGYVRHVNTYSLGAAEVILPHVIAPMAEVTSNHTSWDVLAAHTEMFVAIGGVPWKNAQVTAGGVARHRLREGLGRLARSGARIINIGPVRDNLDAEGAVEWIACRPNTDTALMLGLAFVLLDQGLLDRAFLDRYTVGFDRFSRYLTGGDDGTTRNADWAARITGVPAQRIIELAHEMAAARTMINMAWSLQRASHGEQPCWMLVTLAAMLGQIGLPGGGFGFAYGATNAVGSSDVLVSGPTLPQGANPIEAFIPVARIADMLLQPGAEFSYNGGVYRYPDIRMIYWAGGNPYHHHQDLNRLRMAWRKPETVIIHEQYWTATAKHADIVLPATTSLERDDIGCGMREGHLVAMKTVCPPFAEARDDYAIFAALAKRLGVEEVFTEGLDARQWLAKIYMESRDKMRAKGISIPDFEAFWQQNIVSLDQHAAPLVMFEAFRANPRANPLATPSGRIEIFSETIDGFGLSDCPGHPVWLEPLEWVGNSPGLHLLSDQPKRRLHSQLDASAHSRAGKIKGREPVYLNPQDAAAHQITDGDVVELFNSRGRCLSAAILSENLMPGVARLSTGAWFDPDQYGLEKHGNPNVLTLDRGTSSLGQGSSAQSCIVKIRGPINELPEITAFQPPDISREE